MTKYGFMMSHIIRVNCIAGVFWMVSEIKGQMRHTVVSRPKQLAELGQYAAAAVGCVALAGLVITRMHICTTAVYVTTGQSQL